MRKLCRSRTIRLPAPTRTWAYFFPGYLDISRGLAEVERVVQAGGPIIIVDNYGNDEFSSLLDHDDDESNWQERGFSVTKIDTVFEFTAQEEADRLMSLYAGRPFASVPLTINYRVAAIVKFRGS